MSKALRNSLIVLVLIVVAATLVLVGMYFGRTLWSPIGYGAMNMMDQFEARDDAFGFNSAIDAEPLSLAEAEETLEAYLNGLGVDDLALGEIMIFDNHAYAQFIEADTGIGAMEVLVDPATGAVSPEFGPNMMWNLKYSPMAGSGMMGGFGFASQDGGISGQRSTDLSLEMPVTADEAVQVAQRYLDTYLPGAEADEEADAFYGYYTLHINNDGLTVGMLSVNGYTGQVFLHTWHGTLIEMSESHEQA